MDSALLDVRDLRTQFATADGPVHAVNGVSFRVDHQELVGIVGETGCGKSVTARSIVGLVRPPGEVVGGEARFDGTDLLGLSQRRLRDYRGAQIGFVPQNPWGALNPILRIERQMANVVRAHRKASRDECRALALEGLQKVGIAGPERVLRGYAHELSGGMAQRVVIAMALLLSPALVIADEPTTGLDVTIQRQILDLIGRLLQSERRAMLLVTHDLGIVAQYCHRVIVMYAGKVVEAGDVREVLRNPAHPYTEALLRAIPRPGKRLVHLKGTLPSLIDYPRGCPFRSRCEHAHDHCLEEEPLLRSLENEDRGFACHLPEGVTRPATRTP